MNAARSKEETIMGEFNRMYMWQQSIGENCAMI